MTTINFPKVSIGMPVYNGEMFIQEAIESLISQSYRNFELIISDNNSNDKTAAICIRYSEKDSRIKYIKQEKNIGPWKNFEYVLLKSNSDFFMWAPADDTWNKNHIEFCVNLLIKENTAVAAITKTNCGNPGQSCGDFTIKSKYPFLRRFRYLLNTGPNARFYSLYRRDVLLKLNISEYDFFAGDWALVFDVLKFGNFLCFEKYIGFNKRKHIQAGSNIHNVLENLKKSGSYIIYPLKSFSKHIYIYSKLNLFLYLPVILLLNFQCLNWFIQDLYFRKNE
jgi:glycosyltransferase involved in cell wall biosynthesis